MRRSVLVGAMLVGVALFASLAQATPFQVCVPEKASTAIDSPTAEGTCKAKFSSAYLPTQAEEETLQHIRYEASGIDGKPTLVISGVNVQIDSGLAKDSETNGEGNLLVGLEPEHLSSETGSNKPDLAFGCAGMDGLRRHPVRRIQRHLRRWRGSDRRLRKQCWR
jgi:hypothetical protein